MERAVERDHPAFQVTRAAALASLAARGEHLDSTEEMHFPGNGAARTPEGELYSLLPIASRPSWVAVPSALDLITMRAKGIMPGETSLAAAQPDPVAMPPMGGGVVLEPCAACDGPTRVAVVDLAQDSATVECVACGLRRLGIAAGAVAPLN